MKRYGLFLVLFVGFVFSVFSQQGIAEVITLLGDYSRSRSYAQLTITQKVYTRDSSNATWFDRYKRTFSVDPATIERKRAQGGGTVGISFHDEFKFNITVYDRENDKVVFLECSILYIDGANVTPYANQNTYERSRDVDEPSGRHWLYESREVDSSSRLTNNFLMLYTITLGGDGLATLYR